MALKLNRKLDNNIPTKTHENIIKSEKASLQGFSGIPSAVLSGLSLSSWSTHRQPKLNIREPLNYKDLYGNITDLCKMVETNIILSIKSTYPTVSCILCHLPAFQADSKRFRRVSVNRVSTAKCNETPNTISAMPEA